MADQSPDNLFADLPTALPEELIAAHRKHRVEWTTPDEPTVWLAVFF